METPAFNIGDVVTPKSEKDTNEIGSKYIKYGDTFRVIENNNDFIVDRLLIMVILDDGTELTVFQDRLILASECHECIHACKMRERCPLFEERES